MGFKTFTASPLTSSDVNTYLMKQAAIVCTSSTRPSTPPTGMLIFETDLVLWRYYNGTAWIAINGYAQQQRVANQSITNATFVAMSWDTTNYDNCAAITANVYNAPWTGKYEIGGSLAFAPNATGRRILVIQVAGVTHSTAIQPTENSYTGASGPTVVLPTFIITATSGQSIGLAAYQDSGGALNVTGHIRIAPMP